MRKPLWNYSFAVCGFHRRLNCRTYTITSLFKMWENIEAASDRSENRDICPDQSNHRVSPHWSSKTLRLIFIGLKECGGSCDCEDPPFITEYWSSTTLPSMRNPGDDIQEHVQRGSWAASLKEHGHVSRVTSRKGFVGSLVETWRNTGIITK